MEALFLPGSAAPVHILKIIFLRSDASELWTMLLDNDCPKKIFYDQETIFEEHFCIYILFASAAEPRVPK